MSMEVPLECPLCGQKFATTVEVGHHLKMPCRRSGIIKPKPSQEPAKPWLLTDYDKEWLPKMRIKPE